MNNQFITWMLLIILMLQVGEVFDLNNRLSAVMPAVPTTTATPVAPTPTATATTAGAPVYAECTWENYRNDAHVSEECQYFLYWEDQTKSNEEWGKIISDNAISYHRQSCGGNTCFILLWREELPVEVLLDGEILPIEVFEAAKLHGSELQVFLPIILKGDRLEIKCGTDFQIQVPPIEEYRVRIVQASCFDYSVKNAGTPYDVWDHFR